MDKFDFTEILESMNIYKIEISNCIEDFSLMTDRLKLLLDNLESTTETLKLMQKEETNND